MQNSDIEKCIKMAASGDKFIFEIFFNGCFSKTVEKIFIFEILGYTCFTSYSDVLLKRNEFLYFLSEGFGEKCKHTEVALNFIQKQYFS